MDKLQKYLENKSQKQFTNKSYLDFRNDLLNYAKEHYSDNILDFSEVSVGGMFLDFAAIVGDSLNFYTEQQFKELDYTTATNSKNINNHLRRANIKNNSAYPSSVTVSFSVNIQKDSNSSDFMPYPKQSHLPIIKKGTTLTSNSGIDFVLDEDVDFSQDYDQKIGDLNEDESIYSLILTKDGICTSGTIIQETVNFSNNTSDFFLSYELERLNVTDIISVIDEDLNVYLEVDHLSQGTVYESQKNHLTGDEYLVVKPAVYKFMIEREYDTSRTLIRFGNGNGKSIRNNVFANNTDLLLPYKNKNVTGRVDLDPSMLLKTNSFGISPKGKSVTITYKAGGGVGHNVKENTIQSFKDSPVLLFPNLNEVDDSATRQLISNSITLTNKQPSLGGAPKPSLEELKQSIPLATRSQSRIITHEDLIARILSMPTNFGKIEKAVALKNKFSNLSKDLFIICKDSNNHYVAANDAIKVNLSNFINQFRLISDNYNILDVPVYNFSINVVIRIQAGASAEDVVLTIISDIIDKMQFQNMQIGEPINVNNLLKVIHAPNQVLGVKTNLKDMIKIKSNSKADNFYDFSLNQTLKYSENVLDPISNYIDGFIYPPRGGIFELKFPSQDINIVVN